MSVQPAAQDKEGLGVGHWVPSWQVCGHRARVLRVEKGFFIGVPSHTAFGQRNMNVWAPGHRGFL